MTPIQRQKILILGGVLYALFMYSLWHSIGHSEYINGNGHTVDANYVIKPNGRLVMDYSSPVEMSVSFRGHWKDEPIVCDFVFPRTIGADATGDHFHRVGRVDLPFGDFIGCLPLPTFHEVNRRHNHDGWFESSKSASETAFVLEEVQPRRGHLGRIHRIRVV